jgi:hypothetical protein
MIDDYTISSSSFADINDADYNQHSKYEVLCSMDSISHVHQIKQIDGNTCVFQVELALSSNTNLQMNTFPTTKG